MKKIDEIIDYLKSYSGEKVKIMEVCGTHTAAISESGIEDMLSDNISLVSGPGCPVCVTVASYIDRLIDLSLEPNTVVATFGDMIRVPGSTKSLSDAKGFGAQVLMVYSPMDVVGYALKNPSVRYVFAAVGFETTTPIYALLVKELVDKKIENVQLLTALKTMPKAIEWVCSQQKTITGFIAPGHVSVITGSDLYVPIAEKFNLPFVVAGFEGPDVLQAVYTLVKEGKKGIVTNIYPSFVSKEGNTKAKALVDTYFEKGEGAWRGLGVIPESGMVLKEEFAKYDAGSKELILDRKSNANCCCDRVLVGEIAPKECPLFKTACTPMTPQGSCMVSTEGSCFHHYMRKN